jgi:hypothetical protein
MYVTGIQVNQMDIADCTCHCDVRDSIHPSFPLSSAMCPCCVNEPMVLFKHAHSSKNFLYIFISTLTLSELILLLSMRIIDIAGGHELAKCRVVDLES